MARPDPLATVLRLRKLAADEARRTLAAALAAETEACAQADGARAVRAREITGAGTAPESIAALAAWLPQARAAIAAADQSLAESRGRAEMARRLLAEARATFRAAELLTEQRAAARRDAGLKHAQNALDDMRPRTPDSAHNFSLSRE